MVFGSLSRLLTVRVSPVTRAAAACSLLIGMASLLGCNDNSQDQVRRTQQSLDAAKTKSDSLQDATRYPRQHDSTESP